MRSLSLLVTLLLTPLAPSQLSTKLESASQLYVYAAHAGVPGAAKTWDKGKDLGRRFTLSTTHVRFGRYTASYSTALHAMGLDITRSATFPGNEGFAKEGQGYNDVIWTVAASKARTARLSMQTTVYGRRSNLKAELWIDIGADGSFEYSNTGALPPWSRLVAVGPKPLKILVRTKSTWNWWSGSVVTKLALSRVPPCEVAKYGARCGSILADGPYPLDFEKMYLVQAAGRPNVLGALVVGTQKIAVPLPGSGGCRLYTDPAFVHFYRTNVVGQATLILPIPAITPSFANLQLLNAFDKNGRLEVEAARAAAVLCR